MIKKILFWIMTLILLSSFVSANLITDNQQYFSFDDVDLTGSNPNDLSINNNDGTNNGATTGTAGKIKQEFDYNGINNYVDTNLGYVNPAEFSFIIWINATNPLSTQYIFGSTNGSATDIFLRMVGDGTIRFGLRTASGTQSAISNNIVANNYTQIAGTWKRNDKIKIYQNGVLINSSNTFDETSIYIDLFLGAINNVGGPAGSYFAGSLDEFSTYDVALTQSQIISSYKNGSGCNFYNEICISGNFSITAKEAGTLNTIMNFSAVVNGTTFFSNVTTGILATNITKNATKILNISVSAQNYFTREYNFYNFSENLVAILFLRNLNIGDVLNPINANFYYNLTHNLSNYSVEVTNDCVIIINGTFNGTWCYNLNELSLQDVVLFANTTPIDCYMNLSSDFNTIPVFFEWVNFTNSTLKNGTTTCEHNNRCIVDTLERELIFKNDSIKCRVRVTDFFFTWWNETPYKDVSTIGICEGDNIYPIINMSYFNEKTDDPITLDNSYDLTGFDINIFDGQFEFKLKGNFSGKKSDLICTDVNPATDIINLLIYGQWILSKESFVTKIINLPKEEGFIVSNNPTRYIPFYLLKINESATMTYNWQSNQYGVLDGNMLIYRCENNGSKILIDAPLISNGVATSNLELLTTPYSYEIIVDGITYIDDSFTTCHIESNQERTFFVDTLGEDYKGVIGLFFVSCTLEEIATNVVKMSWKANPADDSSITGCIIAERGGVVGKTQIYKNCTTGKTGSFTRTITPDGNSYYVRGEINQSGLQMGCSDIIEFYTRTTTSEKLGLTGILGVLLLIMCCGLLYTSDGELQIAGSIVGLLAAYILGIVGLGWATMSSILGFAVAIVIIGRYSKKRRE